MIRYLVRHKPTSLFLPMKHAHNLRPPLQPLEGTVRFFTTKLDAQRAISWRTPSADYEIVPVTLSIGEPT